MKRASSLNTNKDEYLICEFHQAIKKQIIRMKYILLLLLFGVIFSCNDKGKIRVQNNIHNVKLESVSWGDYSIVYSLLSGEKSDAITIEDKKAKFPKINVVSFYMVNSGERVYLKTKSKFQLNADQTLTIVITDTTAVFNPSL